MSNPAANGDTPDLEALFDSIANAAHAAPAPPPPPPPPTPGQSYFPTSPYSYFINNYYLFYSFLTTTFYLIHLDFNFNINLIK